MRKTIELDTETFYLPDYPNWVFDVPLVATKNDNEPFVRLSVPYLSPFVLLTKNELLTLLELLNDQTS